MHNRKLLTTGCGFVDHLYLATYVILRDRTNTVQISNNLYHVQCHNSLPNHFSKSDSHTNSVTKSEQLCQATHRGLVNPEEALLLIVTEKIQLDSNGN